MKKVLIANRGEIACRVIRSCRELGMLSVAVYSDADSQSMHVALADESCPIGPSPPRDSYLNVAAIMAAVEQSGADAVHPGYGFLAENAEFAQAVLDAGRVWIGPRPETITAMGDKERARNLAQLAGVPILPGSGRFASGNADEIAAAAPTVGYPLLVKAAGGGGGIGMQRVNDPTGLAKAVASTQALAQRAFGDATIYLEHYVTRARHIEIQVFGFGDGRVVHMFERECSIQRRFQKIIEEAPAPGLDAAVLAGMTSAATALAAQQRYAGAGTVEFVFDDDAKKFYFLEMNTRIQVEHPVTEMTTGLDLVSLQLRLAAGADLSALTQEAIRRSGHAIECRLYAENPDKNFMPAPGRLETLEFPAAQPGMRVDTGVRAGDQITPFYDPMIAKLVGYGESRGSAIAATANLLEAIRIDGLKSNLRFLASVLRHPAFVAGALHTHFVEAHKVELLGS
ncbi:MAG: acetyl-CoA carboxylase biotin carboxylase subunit [Burkholderiales bacterium]|nr:acetyl-CoA carboxylase biotin carboxylase subunit [Burkholderiales bacterium]